MAMAGSASRAYEWCEVLLERAHEAGRGDDEALDQILDQMDLLWEQMTPAERAAARARAAADAAARLDRTEDPS